MFKSQKSNQFLPGHNLMTHRASEARKALLEEFE